MAASPVNITSLSRAANVVTVGTQAAHGLSIGQAAWLQAVTSDNTYQCIFIVVSVPDSVHFTFNQVGANSAPAASGTVVPAKQWIAEALNNGNGGEIDLQIELWFPVTSGNELHNGSGSGFARLTPDETGAIAAGRIHVVPKLIPFPSNYSGASMQAFINNLYQTILAYRNTTLYPGQFYGFFSDGTVNLGRA